LTELLKARATVHSLARKEVPSDGNVEFAKRFRLFGYEKWKR
jgi:hypothetical protein